MIRCALPGIWCKTLERGTMLLLIMLCCYQDNHECLCETLSHFVVHLAELYFSYNHLLNNVLHV